MPVIRGIVPQDIFGVNATAIFVDGVYVSGREGLNFSQLDVERIEVLKGPQSAMYGRNAFAGAINYVTKPPSDIFESKAETELGNRGKQRVMGSVSGPLMGDTLTGRVSAMYDEWDGSYDNTLAPENDIGGYRYRSLQGRLRWRPADNLDINLGLYSSNDEIDDAAVGGVPANCEDQVETTTEAAEEGPFPRLQNWCGRIPDLAALPDRLDPAQFPNMVLLPNSITEDSMPKLGQAVGEDRDLLRGNLNISWDQDFGTFDFLTGYSDTEQNSISDFNRTSGDSMPLIYCPDATTVVPPATCDDPLAGRARRWVSTTSKTDRTSRNGARRSGLPACRTNRCAIWVASTTTGGPEKLSRRPGRGRPVSGFLHGRRHWSCPISHFAGHRFVHLRPVADSKRCHRSGSSRQGAREDRVLVHLRGRGF